MGYPSVGQLCVSAHAIIATLRHAALQARTWEQGWLWGTPAPGTSVVPIPVCNVFHGSQKYLGIPLNASIHLASMALFATNTNIITLRYVYTYMY